MNVFARRCAETKANGEPCGAAPMVDADFCRMHHPDYAADVAEGRRLGGRNRRREVVIAGAYDFRGLQSAKDVLRLLDIAALDTLGQDPGLGRARTLVLIARATTEIIQASNADPE